LNNINNSEVADFVADCVQFFPKVKVIEF